MKDYVVIRKKLLVAIIAAIVVGALSFVAWHFRYFLPWFELPPQVETRSANALLADGEPLIYFESIDADTFFCAPSLTDAPIDCASSDTLSAAVLRRAVRKSKSRLREMIFYCEGAMEEMAYYLDVHGVQEEGYDMVAGHSERTAHEIDSLRQLLDALETVGRGTALSVERTACTRRRDSLCASQFFVGNRGGVWRNGFWLRMPREGMGISRDTLGRVVMGVWAADTLVAGWRTDSLGTYHGMFSRHLQADGHGTFTGVDGSFYEGHWRGDLRDGFGFAVSDTRLRAGEWIRDVYKGERMNYTSERIYGIDISRYQHGHGKKYYPIQWDRLRITYLGRHSRKQLGGAVDYPVSFVYIKSTEGTTVRNRYYASDYAAARRHGLLCGAYHFFSVRSTAAEQARFFIKHSHFRSGDLPPVLDVEPTDAQIAAIGGAEELFRRIRTWMNIVRRHTGVRPILYVNQRFVNKYLVLAPDIKRDYNVWIARYGEYRPDVKLLFWQMCHDGHVTGIHGDVDINVFNGYAERFSNFVDNELIK